MDYFYVPKYQSWLVVDILYEEAISPRKKIWSNPKQFNSSISQDHLKQCPEHVSET